MKVTNKNYPHPVLDVANSDYIDSTFDIALDADPAVTDSSILIDVSYSLECEGLKKLIEEGKAKAAVYLDCSIAEFRRMDSFPFSKTQMQISINKNDVNRSIQLKGFIIAHEAISSFALPEHNKEIFSNVPFSIRKGDVLAIATHLYNLPLDSYDPLADRPSIFAIRKQTERPKEEITADYSGQKITIWLNTETHDKYSKLYEAPETRGFLSSFLAAPILVDVLYFIKNMSNEDRVDCETKKWYQVIDKRLKDLKINLETEDSMTKIANLILPRLFSTSIESMTVVFKALLKGGDKDEN